MTQVNIFLYSAIHLCLLLACLLNLNRKGVLLQLKSVGVGVNVIVVAIT